MTYLAHLNWLHARRSHIKDVDAVKRRNRASLRTWSIEMQDVSDPPFLPILHTFLYLLGMDLGLELLVDLKSVLVDEAGLEVVLVGIPEQIREDLRLVRLAVEV